LNIWFFSDSFSTLLPAGKRQRGVLPGCASRAQPSRPLLFAPPCGPLVASSNEQKSHYQHNFYRADSFQDAFKYGHGYSSIIHGYSSINWHKQKKCQTAKTQASAPCVPQQLRIPVMWATDSGDVGQDRSEATLVVFLH
jgi:hypothetical protein